MTRKIIIRMDDFNREIYLFLKEVGAGIPVDWSLDAFALVRNAVIAAYEKIGIKIEIDDQPQPQFLH